jgi:hypothetical protein
MVSAVRRGEGGREQFIYTYMVSRRKKEKKKVDKVDKQKKDNVVGFLINHPSLMKIQNSKCKKFKVDPFTHLNGGNSEKAREPALGRLIACYHNLIKTGPRAILLFSMSLLSLSQVKRGLTTLSSKGIILSRHD